tara:strand:+ start:987 stop:1451 length:465 start_codon:yes stop_codon:yes gene_type:complete
MSYKGKINFLGYEISLILPKKYLKINENNGWGYLTIGGIGSIVRQVLNYLKKHNVIHFDKIWIRTESYSGGDSVSVYSVGCDEGSVDWIKSVMKKFEWGSFNAYEDLYEIKSSDKKLFANFDVGFNIKVEVGSKYNFHYPHPPYDVQEKMMETV